MLSVGDLFGSSHSDHQGPPIPSTHHCSFNTSHVWSRPSHLLASSDHPTPLADTEIRMWHPWRSCNAGWPRYTTPSCILGCVQHVLSNQPITLQDPLRKGRVHGSSQRAPVLDWSRHNYHVNTSCASGDTIHAHSLGACFPHQSQGTRTLWWHSFGVIKKLSRVWKKEAKVLKNSACCCVVIYPYYCCSNSSLSENKVNSGDKIPDKAEVRYFLHQKQIETKLKAKYYTYPMAKTPKSLFSFSEISHATVFAVA